MSSEWRPIAEAPKDGSQVLCFAADSIGGPPFYGVAEWADADADFPNTVDGWFWAYAQRPTHWMPLPEPPEQPQ